MAKLNRSQIQAISGKLIWERISGKSRSMPVIQLMPVLAFSPDLRFWESRIDRYRPKIRRYADVTGGCLWL